MGGLRGFQGELIENQSSLTERINWGGHRKLTVNEWESLDYYRTLKRSGKFNCDTAKFSDLLPPPPQMKF